MEGRSGERGRERPTALVLIATAILCGTAGAASAEDTELPLTLKSENVAPRTVFFHGMRMAAYHFSIGGARPRDLTIEVVNRETSKVVRSWRPDNVAPYTKQTIRWAGKTTNGGAARKGKYLFRVRQRGGDLADRGPVPDGVRSFGLYPHKFPVRARHTYGDGFGAPRPGHSHRGQDIMADCGTKVVAARGGTVEWRAYQGGVGAGYYLVIDGEATGRDTVYMHLRRRGRPMRGARVRTGEPIGWVGKTGTHVCHLHFELWSAPGWYDGGHAMRSVTKRLKRWDHFS